MKKPKQKDKIKNFFDIPELDEEEPSKQFEKVTLFTLTKNKIFSGILIFGLIANLLVLFDIQCLYLRAIFSFIFLITIPGLLIMLIMKIRKINSWEYFVYVVGLSITFLIFAGLFVNWTLPLIGISKPLSLIPLLISFNIFLLIFWLVAYKRNKKISLRIKLPKLGRLNKLFLTIPMVFPVLSVLGAIILNNHGPNYLTMTMLGGIAVYVFLVVLFRNKLNKDVYPFAILMISTSLLLMGWLRSWYVSGMDINVEYHIFQLIKENFHWSMSLFRHAYNACLSVSLLPTILSFFLKINDQYIFKLIIPLLFSITPIGVYLFLKRYVKNILAFIAVFFFMSQSIFMTWHWIPIRQGMALLFFTLTLLILFNKDISPILKKSLFLIFGFSMIFFHYSTTYVALALFVFTYFICFVFKKTENKKPFSKIYEKLNLKEKGKKSKERKYYLSGILVLLLLIFTFLWLSQLTGASDNLVDFTHKTIQNMGDIFTEEVKTETALKSVLSFREPKYTASFLKDYSNSTVQKYRSGREEANFYNHTKYKDYKINIKVSKSVPITELSKKMPVFKKNISYNVYFLRQIATKLVEFLIIIGVLYLLFTQFKEQKIDREFIIMCLIGVFLVVAIVILPFASISYDLSRTFQQLLTVLSLPAVFGGLLIFKFFKENIKIFMILVIFLYIFLIFSGFIGQVTGGAPAYAQLNNYGFTYDGVYTHTTEIKSANWLFNNYNNKNLIFVGNGAANKLLLSKKYLNIVRKVIFPSLIYKNAYIYTSYTNIIGKKTLAVFQGNQFNYNYPIKFLNENKNKIYNNGGSEIFK